MYWSEYCYGYLLEEKRYKSKKDRFEISNLSFLFTYYKEMV